MIPTPITLDEDRQYFEYVVYVCRCDEADTELSLPVGHSAHIGDALAILEALPATLPVAQQAGVVIEIKELTPLNHKWIVWRDASIEAVLHASIQLESSATVRRLFDEAQ